MTTMNLALKDGIHFLTLTNGDDDNRFTTPVVREYLAALDTVEEYKGNTALVLTSEHEKTFSTGINLDWLTQQDSAGKAEFLIVFETLLCRFALLSAPTVACINGNAYAGGGILAAAADYRIMRSDRGRFCFPEVNINIPFTQVTNDIVHLLPNKHALKNMMLTGVAYTGEQCVALNIVEAIFPAEALQAAAFELAKTLASKDRNTYSTIRNLMRPAISVHLQQLTDSK